MVILFHLCTPPPIWKWPGLWLFHALILILFYPYIHSNRVGDELFCFVFELWLQLAHPLNWTWYFCKDWHLQMLVVCRGIRHCKLLANSLLQIPPLWMASLIWLFILLRWNLPLQLHHFGIWLKETHFAVFACFFSILWLSEASVPFPWLCWCVCKWQRKLYYLKTEIISWQIRHTGFSLYSIKKHSVSHLSWNSLPQFPLFLFLFFFFFAILC